MDAYQQQQQQPHRYMRPPPPPPQQQQPAPADPHLQQQHYYQYQPPPRAAAPPPPGSWYSNQFQFQYQQQHHNQSHSAPPHHPPPHPPSAQQPPSQWGPHPDHSAYPPPPPLPFPPHPHNGSNHFLPPPPPPVHRPYMPPSQIPNTFSHVNQEWSNTNWSHHQAHNNVEDWGAKAREWANTRAAMQDQQVESQITPAGRPEEQNHFHDPYSQAVDSHYMDAQQSLPIASYQQFPVPAASPHGPPATYPNETLSNSSRPFSYFPDACPPYHVRDGTSLMDPNSGFLHQESLSASSSFHLQEVPSSYSSVSGKEKSADEKDQSYKSLPLPVSSAQDSAYHMQPPLPDIGRSVLGEQSLSYGSQAGDPAADLSDRPLDFAPRFNNDHDRQMLSNYAAHHESLGRGVDPIAISSSFNSWTPPVAPDAVYPPVLPPGAQHDPMSAPSPVSGHTAPSFPRFPGPSFQPHIPSATAPFGLGVGAQLHPAAAFPGDMYGAVSERPKKGPVPNWLKEEILRNKATIAKSSLEHPKEETESIEDEAVDKSLAKSDQADSKSVDSSRSTEEDDDDEDYVEAARTAAINQEIKRVLTEVLLKVTDELFSEIATKVVNEEDSIVDVDHSTVASNHKVSPSSSLVPSPKASARVLVPGKAKESYTAEEKSSSSSPGNVLGLANYASDDEDVDGETQSSRMPDSRSNDAVVQSSSKKLSQDSDVTDNGNSQAVPDEHWGVEKNFGSDMKSDNRSDTADDGAVRNYEKSFSSKVVSGYECNINSGKMQDGNNGSMMNDTLGERVTKKSDSELPDESAGKRSTKSESQNRETRVKSDKNDRHESRKSYFSKDPGSGRELEVIKSRGEQKGVENYMREDERLRKKKIEARNGSKEIEKEPKSAEKAKESDSRKRSSHHDAKDDKKDASRSNRAGAKEDVGRKRERTKEEDRSRHKHGSDSSRHKRRRSLSISSRGRRSKDDSTDNSNESSDETSDCSKRKSRSRKRSSPSPFKSRRRQVSRSPHSKHSQRWHSP
ncbi:dentin sialophosphoprotein-like isoform X1 [Hibiscus syriacus]|uniref:dentin sialophosphoprotein-like isoform X1 n=1 Tax=Hibiscus syriacus TaxID=106335 RepID=UPI001922C3DC|nr:dentin sialophosphoprotein-like isoform X1 [Hibiscus syriacus]